MLPETPWPTVRRLDTASHLAAGPRAEDFAPLEALDVATCACEQWRAFCNGVFAYQRGRVRLRVLPAGVQVHPTPGSRAYQLGSYRSCFLSVSFAVKDMLRNPEILNISRSSC